MGFEPTTSSLGSRASRERFSVETQRTEGVYGPDGALSILADPPRWTAKNPGKMRDSRILREECGNTVAAQGLPDMTTEPHSRAGIPPGGAGQQPADVSKRSPSSCRPKPQRPP